MIFKILLFALLAALWCAVVWFALPLDLRTLPTPTLAALHVGPPVAYVAVWALAKRVFVMYRAWAKKAADAAQAAEEQTRREAARAEYLADIERRRAHAECRGVWMEVLEAPRWHGEESAQCVISAQDAKALASLGARALAASLQRVFEEAFAQCGAAAYLPVHVFVGDGSEAAIRLDQVKQAWQAAVTALGFGDETLRPDCRLLSGEGDIASRVVALFDSDPALPALWLAGLDSRLGEVDASPRAGHCAVAVLLSRPGLVLADRETVEHDEHDPYIPFWEFEHGVETDSTLWSRIPPSLRWGLLALPPVALLYRARTLRFDAPGGKGGALAQRIQGLIEPLLVDTGLRDQSFTEEGRKGEKPEQGDAPEPLDVGWVVHDCGLDRRTVGKRLAGIALALSGFGCEIDPFDETSDINKEHGDTGTARSVLMLAESLIRSAQLQKPVLTVEFDDPDIGVGLTRPPLETNEEQG
ncbi:MAG: hypothetical protein LBI92_09585 [Azoarcus sp.]|jgi:hypothetical protein|nr:hypothetical protein [Azoarcus sp.]